MKDFTWKGMRCSVWEPDGALKEVPLLILAGGEQEDVLFQRLEKRYKKGAPGLLIAFQVSDWNDAYSPWPMEKIYRDGSSFGGKGRWTLQWLTEELIPWADQAYAVRVRMIAGYSLAGLFALWSFYESGLFDGCASCSGSLWFAGWMEYAKTHRTKRPSISYLSLGRKEEKTKNSYMQRVGDCTRQMAEWQQEDPLIRENTLVWQDGGHFNDPAGRVMAGMDWLWNRLKTLTDY